MKTIKIVERTTSNEEKLEGRNLAVDLIIDGETINTGRTPISSYAFWDDLEKEAQRALYSLDTKNPKMNFDFSLSTMTLSEDQKKKRFLDYAKSKHPDINVEKIFEIIDTEVNSMQLTGPDDNHPNPYMKFPIGGDLPKMVLLKTIEKYLKNESDSSSK